MESKSRLIIVLNFFYTKLNVDTKLVDLLMILNRAWSSSATGNEE